MSWEHQYLYSCGASAISFQSAGSVFWKYFEISSINSNQLTIHSIQFKSNIILVISKFFFLEKTIKEALRNEEAKYERHLSEVKTKNFRYSHLWILSKNCPILLDSFFKNPNNRRRKSSSIAFNVIIIYRTPSKFFLILLDLLGITDKWQKDRMIRKKILHCYAWNRSGESVLKKKKTMTHENLTLCKPIFVFFKGQGSKIKKKKEPVYEYCCKKTAGWKRESIFLGFQSYKEWRVPLHSYSFHQWDVKNVFY